MKILERIEALETHVKDELANIRKEMLENIKSEFVDEWPQNGDTYYSVDMAGMIEVLTWEGIEFDFDTFKQGNVFRTKQESEHKAARDRAVTEWNRLAGSQDWYDLDDDTNKYYPARAGSCRSKEFEVCNSVCLRLWPYAHFKTFDKCQAAIDKMGPDKIKLLFEGC